MSLFFSLDSSSLSLPLPLLPLPPLAVPHPRRNWESIPSHPDRRNLVPGFVYTDRLRLRVTLVDQTPIDPVAPYVLDSTSRFDHHRRPARPTFFFFTQATPSLRVYVCESHRRRPSHAAWRRISARVPERKDLKVHRATQLGPEWRRQWYPWRLL